MTTYYVIQDPVTGRIVDKDTTEQGITRAAYELGYEPHHVQLWMGHGDPNNGHGALFDVPGAAMDEIKWLYDAQLIYDEDTAFNYDQDHAYDGG